MTKTIKHFKGGSLSSTCLLEDGGKLFVRKSVSLVHNREYGFQRWYSQLKKLQRYSIMFPGLFPSVLNYGMTDNDAYFDMEFYKDAINAHQYIDECNSQKKVDIFFKSLITAINTLHRKKFNSSKNSIGLYIHEEIDQRLKDCYKEKFFLDFLDYKKIIFNGKEINSFVDSLSLYRDMLNKHFNETSEIFSHGNMTLENILYIPQTDRVIFIDPYEENIIDSELAEYSQLLQSSNSKYEIYSSKKAIINENNISLKVNESFGINYFNKILLRHIKNKFNQDQYKVIRLLEVSQFIRMLPFKMAIDKSKMIFFYGLASFLFDNIQDDAK